MSFVTGHDYFRLGFTTLLKTAVWCTLCNELHELCFDHCLFVFTVIINCDNQLISTSLYRGHWMLHLEYSSAQMTWLTWGCFKDLR